MTKVIVCDWDTSLLIWKNTTKYEQRFDERGNDTLSLSFYGDGEGKWTYINKTKYMVGEKQQESIVHYDWSTLDSQWVATKREDYTFDSLAPFPTLLFVQGWDPINNEWSSMGREEVHFDAKGHETMLVQYQWNPDNKSNELRRKEEYSYDAKGQLTQLHYFTWDAQLGGWRTTSKNETVYDVKGNPVSIIGSEWDATTKRCENKYKEELTYDGKGAKSSVLISYWQKNEWRMDTKEEYEHDGEGNLVNGSHKYTCVYNQIKNEGSHPYSIDLGKSTHQLVSKSVYKWYRNRWVSAGVYRYYYS
jgi:hypothetical protein